MKKRPLKNLSKLNCDAINSEVFGDLSSLNWMMSPAERCSLIYLVKKIKPKCAIEIGTAEGGSLQIISKYSQITYSIDIDPEAQKKNSNRFKNVIFVSGDSKSMLPETIQLIEKQNIALNFVLLDGNHSYEGVKNDINNTLQYTPKEILFILVHDSFNPECRRGILDSNWSQNPYVHHVEIDWVPGVYVTKQKIDKSIINVMWGGLTLAILKPFKRKSEFALINYDDRLFNLIKKDSDHK